jgi:hypothetical protein
MFASYVPRTFFSNSNGNGAKHNEILTLYNQYMLKYADKRKWFVREIYK